MAKLTATKTYNLELSEDELKMIFILTGCVTGDTNSYRKYSDSVYNEITKLLDGYDLDAKSIKGTVEALELPND